MHPARIVGIDSIGAYLCTKISYPIRQIWKLGYHWHDKHSRNVQEIALQI